MPSFRVPKIRDDRFEPMRAWRRAAAELIDEILETSTWVLSTRDEILKGLDLTSGRLALLRILAQQEQYGPLSVSDLARKMNLARQSARRLARALACHGMISFEPNPQDRRAPFVILESRGKRAIADAETQTVPWLFDLARGFEEKTLKRIVWSLRTIRWRLGERNKIYTD